jgi:hypothetical protein
MGLECHEAGWDEANMTAHPRMRMMVTEWPVAWAIITRARENAKPAWL